MAGTAMLVLFGATGDLAATKILPALGQWEGPLPFGRIWCLGRRPLDTDAYLAVIEAKSGFRPDKTLRETITYHPLDFNDPSAYGHLARRIDADGAAGHHPRLFFLAVKPEVFLVVTAGLHQAGLFKTGDPGCRLLFEKPFGEDLASAERIQERLMTMAREEQVYRIDHYLGKDMIRNLLSIRLANRLFSESWHGGAIETVTLLGSETSGVAERIDYYDRAGAINDMVQSHLLQMLALVAMEPPEDLSPDAVRRAKVEVLRQVVIETEPPPVVGQYVGYGEAAPGSRTETYVEAVLRVDAPRWQDARFILRTGKMLTEKRTVFRIEYRPNRLCPSCAETIEAEPNRLTIEVFPSEGVLLQFNSKTPGYGYELTPVTAEYCHSCRTIGNRPESYVKLLMDALEGDQTLFTGFEELRAQWRIADRLRAKAARGRLHLYPPGVDRVEPEEAL